MGYFEGFGRGVPPQWRRRLAYGCLSTVILICTVAGSGARPAFLKAKEILDLQLKQIPDSPDMHIQLAKVLAYLGEKDAALAEARRATDLLPESKDAFGGPEITAGVAEVYCIVGENSRAIELLDGLLGRPSAVTVQGLKVNPVWDPLRNDPQFQALLNKHSAKT